MKPVDYDSQEWSVHYYPADGKICKVYTTIPSEMNRLDKLCEQYPDTYQMVKNDGYGKKYLVPRDRIRFIPPVSEARREAGKRAAQHLDSYRQSLDCNEASNTNE